MIGEEEGGTHLASFRGLLSVVEDVDAQLDLRAVHGLSEPWA